MLDVGLLALDHISTESLTPLYKCSHFHDQHFKLRLGHALLSQEKVVLFFF